LTVPSPKAARGALDFGWLALGLALAVGAATRFWNLDAASLHTDEAFTFAISSLPLPALLHSVTVADFHPPLFYIAAHSLLHLRWQPWNYRYLTAAFGLVTIVATWGAARRMYGPTAAGVAALAVALQPALLQHERLFRMYAVTVALCTCTWWLLLEAGSASGGKRLWLWIGYGLAAAILPYVDYLGAFMLACQGLYALARPHARSPALVALAVAMVAYIPWIPHLHQQLELGGIALSRPGLDAGLAAALRGAFAAGIPSAWFAWPLTAFAPAAALAALIAAAAWLGRRSALPFWLGALVLAVALSIVWGKNLAYFPRYLLIDVPPVCIAFGLIVSRLWSTRLRLAGAALALAGLSCLALAVSNVLWDPYYQFPDWYAVNALVFSKEQPGDAVILDAGYELLVVQNYTAFRGRTILTFMNPGDFENILTWIERHPGNRVWYIQHQNFYWDPQRRIAAALAKKRTQELAYRWPRESPVDEVSVVLFEELPMKKIP
jgi:uncharacterized membrane protein